MKKGSKLCASIVVVVCLLTIGCSSDNGSDHSDHPKIVQLRAGDFEKRRCRFFSPDGETAECGYLHVLENRNEANSRTIKIAVAILKSTGLNPEPDPVIYLSGGPGGPALVDIDFYRNATYEMRQKRDVIIFDQRGVGFSEPSLNCYSVRPDLTGQLSFEQNCYDRFKAQGVDFSGYNSTQSASDIEDLRVALGLDQINLFGVSYGTKLALHYIRDFGEHVRSAILDSVVPLEVNIYEESVVKVDNAFTVFFQACEQDAACNTAFPQLETMFYELVAGLNETPAEIALTIQGVVHDIVITGDDFISFLFQALYSERWITQLPLCIASASAGNFDPLIPFLENLYDYNRDFSQGMHLSVRCNEEVPFNRIEICQANLDNYPLIGSAFESSLAIYDTCDFWDSGIPDPLDNAPVDSNVPALILSGEFDPITPPAYGLQVAEKLSNSYAYSFSGLCHGVAFGGDCAMQMALHFLDDPVQDPFDECYDFLAGPVFETDIQVAAKRAVKNMRKPSFWIP